MFSVGGYDPRLEDNMMTLVHLIDRAKAHSLSYNIIAPSTSSISIPPFNTTEDNPTILFLLNFTTPQRSALLSASSTLALLYTPSNEHFGIGPIEAMVCGLPVLACNNGGPTESVVDADEGRTGWLREPTPELWAETLFTIVYMDEFERRILGERAKSRARENFGMEAMASGIESALIRAVDMGPIAVPLAVWSIPLAIFFVLLGFYLI
jgi:alpha-1,3/alpha-1,6-mannosyltransferase